MRIPRFWQKADDGGVLAWGWSDTSAEDAMAKAAARARKIRDWIDRGGPEPEAGMPYGYPDRPMREEVLREFQDARGNTIAAVSQNRAGCLVLNTVNLLFVDVDSPAGLDSRPGGILGWLFGRKPEKPASALFDEKMTGLASDWISAEPRWGWRVYRTRGGARFMATHAPIAHDDPAVARVFSRFEADPLYRNLCEKQECFRARLTPKTWRCKAPKPPTHWPWEDTKAETQFRDWEKRYLDAAKDFATCKLLGQFGVETIHPDLRELVEYHDSATRVDTDLPLA